MLIDTKLSLTTIKILLILSLLKHFSSYILTCNLYYPVIFKKEFDKPFLKN